MGNDRKAQGFLLKTGVISPTTKRVNADKIARSGIAVPHYARKTNSNSRKK